MRRRKAKKISPRFFRMFIAVSAALFTVIAFGSYQLWYTPPALRPLAILKVPAAPTIYLPGPYIETEDFASDVLGAETIDPKDIALYINAERLRVNAPPLRINQTLMKAAQMRADVILRHQNFSHQDPYENIQLDTVLPKVGYQYSYASENIGMGDDTAKRFVFGFMHSTAHRENLLNPLLRETGVAVVTGPYQQYYVNIAVQLFAIPVSRQQYLGYSDEDIEQYRRLLTDIENQIALAQGSLAKNADNRQYYENWEKLLIRQRQIVATLYEAMRLEQPFVHNLISLIREYNNNWNSVPKQTRS